MPQARGMFPARPERSLPRCPFAHRHPPSSDVFMEPVTASEVEASLVQDGSSIQFMDVDDASRVGFPRSVSPDTFYSSRPLSSNCFLLAMDGPLSKTSMSTYRIPPGV